MYDPKVTGRKAATDAIVSALLTAAVVAIDALANDSRLTGELPAWLVPVISSLSTALTNLWKNKGRTDEYVTPRRG